MTKEDIELLKCGLYLKNGKQYGLCAGCGKIVRLNGFFGGMHLCSQEEVDRGAKNG